MSDEQCCRQRPCIRPGKGPCDMPTQSAARKYEPVKYHGWLRRMLCSLTGHGGINPWSYCKRCGTKVSL